MKCPECKKELTSVDLYSKCWQKVDIDKEGRTTTYGPVEEILETLSIECPYCQKEIKGVTE
jgi:DNA-directed RNA polymerase subunit RPC12/RpoP